MKKCNKCRVKLVIGDNWFECNAKYKKYICKSCTNQYFKKWVINNPEKFNQSVKKWEKNNPERVKKLRSKWKSKWGKGVYALFSKGQCLYVGESKVIAKRLADHFSYFNNPETTQGNNPKLYENLRQYDYIYCGIVENCNNHKEREKYWIDKLQPLYNSTS